jgi:HD-GYP domain-containing protein (c-di-GMP phosphodiesterase class II)
MTENRPYRAALGEAEARNELEQGAGAQFDADCVQALLHALDRRDAAATVVTLRPPAAALLD